MITYSHAKSMMETARNGRRKLGNNTYLETVWNGKASPDYGVRYHATIVITIHEDGTFTLNTGGWHTITTKARLNDYSPARVYSVDGTLCVVSSDDPRTPPKVKKCRACAGSGKQTSHAWTGWEGTVHPATEHNCYRCGGSGQNDYGSKPRPVMFYDGIKVDAWGHVISPDAQRIHETDEEREAREARILRERRAEDLAQRRVFFREYGLAPKRGKVVMFKAVNDSLNSPHGMPYPIGETVTAKDWSARRACGQGLHFGPSVAAARRYAPEATRFLACEIAVKGMVVLDDKIKVKSARVLYEVDTDGARIPAHSDYPHEPGRLYDCPACEARCYCRPDFTECIYSGEHNGTADQS